MECDKISALRAQMAALDSRIRVGQASSSMANHRPQTGVVNPRLTFGASMQLTKTRQTVFLLGQSLSDNKSKRAVKSALRNWIVRRRVLEQRALRIPPSSTLLLPRAQMPVLVTGSALASASPFAKAAATTAVVTAGGRSTMLRAVGSALEALISSSTLRIQCVWRGHVGRKAVRGLRRRRAEQAQHKAKAKESTAKAKLDHLESRLELELSHRRSACAEGRHTPSLGTGPGMGLGVGAQAQGLSIASELVETDSLLDSLSVPTSLDGPFIRPSALARVQYSQPSFISQVGDRDRKESDEGIDLRVRTPTLMAAARALVMKPPASPTIRRLVANLDSGLGVGLGLLPAPDATVDGNEWQERPPTVHSMIGRRKTQGDGL